MRRVVEVTFESPQLEELEKDKAHDARYPPGIGKVFRRRMQFIRAAPDERDFYQLRSLNFEKLKGDRIGQHSMRLNDQWRLILTFVGESPNKLVVIISIEDYH
jgi:proteic killer suppression protein